MKKINQMLFLICLVLAGIVSNAQSNLTVTCSSPYIGNGLIKPMKAGSSIQFQIKVKNNDTATYTISIDKNAMSYGSWLQIDNNNSLVLPRNQEGTFQLTLTVPAGTSDLYRYPFPFYFYAYYKGINNPYTWTTLSLIVDNTPPVVPSVSIHSTSSNSITVTWSGSDAISSTYTLANSTSGEYGIKSYTVALRSSDGQTPVADKSYSAPTIFPYYYTFSSLSNTSYKLFVTATDLAGNPSTNAGLPVTTPPAAPNNLSATSTTYCGTTLTWTASPGATGYLVYQFNSSTNTSTYRGYTPSTSFLATGLTAGTTNHFYVKATSSVGESLQSGLLAMATLSIPTPLISGPSLFCTSSATYYADNLPSGCTVLWDQSPNLNAPTTSGNSATFTSNGVGSGWVSATFNSGCGTRSNTNYFMVGVPQISSVTFENPVGGLWYWCSSYYGNTFSVETSDINASYEARLLSWPSMNVLQTNSSASPGSDPFGYVSQGIYVFQLNATNGCGSSSWYESEIEYLDCNGNGEANFMILASPNPTSDVLNVTIDKEKPEVKALSKSEKVHYVLYDQNRMQLAKSWVFDNSQNQQSLNVSGLNVGQYILVVTKGKFRQSIHILIR